MAKTEYNFKELVDEICQTTQRKRIEVEPVVFYVFQLMARALAKEKRIEIKEIGVFKLQEVAERRGKTSGKIGPVTEWVKDAHYAVKFKPMPDFINWINEYLPADSPLKAAK